MIYTFSPDIRHLLVLLIIFSLSVQACSQQNEPTTEQEQENTQTASDAEDEAAETDTLSISEQDEAKMEIAMEHSAEDKTDESMYDASGAFTVQLGAFRNQYMAENEVGKWESEGFDRIFMQQEGNVDTGDIWYRVYAGRYASYQDAKEMATRIEQEENEKAWARRLTRP